MAVFKASDLELLEDLDQPQYMLPGERGDEEAVSMIMNASQAEVDSTVIIGGDRIRKVGLDEAEYQYQQEEPQYYEEEPLPEEMAYPDAMPYEEEETTPEGLKLTRGYLDALNAKKIPIDPDMVSEAVIAQFQQVTDDFRAHLQDQVDFTPLFPVESRDQLILRGLSVLGQVVDPDYYEQVFRDLDQQVANIVELQRQEIIGEIIDQLRDATSGVREQLQEEFDQWLHQATEDFRQSLLSENELFQSAQEVIDKQDQIFADAEMEAQKKLQETASEIAKNQKQAKEAAERAKMIIADAEKEAENIKHMAEIQAAAVLEKGKNEAAQIVEEAESYRQEMVEAATQDGFNAGYQEGREEAIKENAELLLETTQALNRLYAAFPHAVRQNEEKLIKLAMEIASAVLQEELSQRPELAARTLESAIKRVSDLERVTIKVNPLDLDIVLPKQEYFRSLLPDVQDFAITGHYAISRGGCMIETNSGTIDAQIASQLAVLEEVFQRVRSEYDQPPEEAPAAEEEPVGAEA